MPDATPLPFTGNVHPMLFKGPLVLAMLREVEKPGTGKTVTRRLPKYPGDVARAHRIENTARGPIAREYDRSWPVRTEYRPGDLIYVRETFVIGVDGDMDSDPDGNFDKFVIYQDGADQEYIVPRGYTPPANSKRHVHFSGREGAWTEIGSIPSILMPRWASRLTLHVTEVTVERLRDISGRDCVAEGCELARWKTGVNGLIDIGIESETHHLRDMFSSLWDSTKPKPGFWWEDNPWVIRIAFQPELANVDKVLSRLGAGEAA